MCIERNWDILFWGSGRKAAVRDTSLTAACNLSCQISYTCPATAGLVHSYNWVFADPAEPQSVNRRS
jgi:hypothetical protein